MERLSAGSRLERGPLSRGSAGHPAVPFKGLISCSLFPRTSPGSAVVLPRRRRPTFLRFLNSLRVSGKEQTVSTFFPGSLTSLGHPVCDCHCASPAKKSSKGHAFAVRQPPDPSLFFPSSTFLRNFSRPSATFFVPSLLSVSLFSECTHRSLPVPQASSGPALGA
jgi:hypothetical protein